MKKSKSEVMPQISNSYVKEFFRRRIRRIKNYEVLNLKEDEVMGLFPFLYSKPIMSTEKITVRRNGNENSFRIKISLKFFHFFLQPVPKFEEKETEDYRALSDIQKKIDPPELAQALRRTIGLRKGREYLIPRFLTKEKTKILPREDTSQVTVVFKKVLLLEDFRP